MDDLPSYLHHLRFAERIQNLGDLYKITKDPKFILKMEQAWKEHQEWMQCQEELAVQRNKWLMSAGGWVFGCVVLASFLSLHIPLQGPIILLASLALIFVGIGFCYWRAYRWEKLHQLEQAIKKLPSI